MLHKETVYVGNITVRGMIKTWYGKLQHASYSFSFKYVLIKITLPVFLKSC
jgi:hypothetical protein